jgi:hypothetical protein
VCKFFPTFTRLYFGSHKFSAKVEPSLIWEERYCNVWVVLRTTLLHMHKRSGGGHSSCVSWRVRGGGVGAEHYRQQNISLFFFVHSFSISWSENDVIVRFGRCMHTTQLDLNRTWNYETCELCTSVCLHSSLQCISSANNYYHMWNCECKHRKPKKRFAALQICHWCAQ